MVSTYFSYSYITRNLKQSLTRVEQQHGRARERPPITKPTSAR